MELLHALLNVVESVALLIWQLVLTVAPWTPLLAWVAFWTLAVDWVKLRGTLLRGGLIGILLIGLVFVLIWGVVAPPQGGTHYLLGLQVSNFVGKTVYVTALFVIMFLCGSVQLSGCCDRYLCLQQPAGGDDHEGHGHDDAGHGDHGHDAHDSHGH